MRELLYVFGFVLLFGCRENEPKNHKITVNGYAQGTTYSIVYISEDGENYQRAIDSTLIEIDNSMSTYNKNSIISRWNASIKGDDVLLDENFMKVLTISEKVNDKTGGLFDPAIGSLIRLWEFNGEDGIPIADSSIIDSVKAYIGFHNIRNEGNKLYKLREDNVELNFNAVAQGYTVDVLGGLLEKRGITNYMVEVGGEVKAKGINMEDTLWRIGIDKPLPDLQEREIEAIIHLNNKALATSGNYRKFYEKDGKKYSHTINPITGYPVEHNLLSATVIADECAYADAYATAFMVMGLEESKKFLQKHPELEALLIFSDENGLMQTFMTIGLESKIELNPNKK